MRRLLVVTCFIACVWAVPSIARAVGGIYVDDIAITNNGAPVFSDNFDDGSISDWYMINDAAVTSAHSHSPSDSLYLNWHGAAVADAIHHISVAQPSVMDYSAWVYLPPVSEQYKWNHNGFSFTNLVLHSGNTSSNLGAGVELYPNESAYRIWLHWNNFGGTNTTAVSGVVLAANTWAQLTLRMDNASGNAYALFNGQQLTSISYNPQSFQSFNRASVWGWLGDGVAPVPEPGSLLALLCGIGATGAVMRRRTSK